MVDISLEQTNDKENVSLDESPINSILEPITKPRVKDKPEPMTKAEFRKLDPKSKARIVDRQNQEIFLEIFRQNMCLVTPACERANISRKTFYDWYNKKSWFAEAVDDLRDSLKDFGEAAFFKLMKEGNPQAILHYQKTKNRDRGYGDVVQNINQNFDMNEEMNKIISRASSLTKEERAKLLKEYR